MKHLSKFVFLLIAAIFGFPLFAGGTHDYHKMDVNVNINVCSLKGGWFSCNPHFAELEDKPYPENPYMIAADIKGDIASDGKISFSWAMGLSEYSYRGEENKPMSIGISLGAGMYFNYWSKSSLTGPCLFFYPLYHFPLYTKDCGDPIWRWKQAFDLGCTFRFLGPFTIFPYARMVIAWNNFKPDVDFDVGLSFGLYLEDSTHSTHADFKTELPIKDLSN